MNKHVIAVAVVISLAALAITPLLQSTGLATAPLSEMQENSVLFLQEIKITSGSLLKLDIIKHLES